MTPSIQPSPRNTAMHHDALAARRRLAPQSKISTAHEGVQGSRQVGVASMMLRSGGDLMDRENSRQALWEIRRATTDADFAAWARKWGEAAVLTIEGNRR